MKKLIKTVLYILLLFIVGIGGYTIGSSQLFFVDSGTDNTKVTAQISKLKSVINEYFLFDVDDQKLNDGVYKGLFEGLDDPYSTYYNEEEYEDLMEETSGEYAGIGIVVSGDSGDYITVISAFDNTPGDLAGLKSGDLILSIDGKSFLATDLEEAVSSMRGEPGTDVVLTIRRKINETESETKDVTITREQISIETVSSSVLADNVGYLRILQFSESTFSQFEEQLQSLLAQNVKGIVLDLRNNPGGLVDVTLEIADTLLGEGIIVSTVDKKGNEIVETSDSKMISVPINVLINEGSASASEILAGAIKDHQRGKIIGTQSYGKGIVQQLFPLGKDGPGFKLTVSEYYSPNKTKIHGVGVTPDIEVPLNDGVDKIGIDFLDQDNQLQRAIQEMK